MTNLSLAKINEAVEASFGDFTINLADEGQPEDVIAFRYFLRAPKEARTKLAAAFSRLEAEASEDDGAGELVKILQAALEALAVKPEHYEKLKAALGDDLVLWSFVVTEYGNRYDSQVGEA